ncbi:MAG: hypothetical protein COV66_05680 [Nitrospinae bacterium CG11_big_fil_rev_8_21_14_0_20_45_15]|nr:MAG: hypothetical protein COV66_05680 [Nitrospinae bacterium CG11_big_fil_rev_8_21_14_0_20_45_15]
MFEKIHYPKHILIIGMGFLLGLVISYWMMDFDFVRTIGSREQVRSYDLFNPLYKGKSKHVLLSSCFTVNNVTYTDLWDQNPAQPRHHGTAYLSQVLNYLLKKEYGDKNDLFFEMGAPDVYVTEHLFQLGHILKAPNVKTIIYSNLSGGLHSFYEKDLEILLQTRMILEEWKKTFPEARAYLDEYLKGLDDSKEFKEAKNKFPDYLSKTSLKILPEGTVPPKNLIAEIFSNHSFKKISSLENFLISNFSHIKRSDDLEWEQTLERNLEKALALYKSPMNDRTFRLWADARKLSYDQKKKPSYAIFLNILASICKARGIQLIYYFPPMLSISAQDYDQKFKPDFIDPIRRIIEPYGALIIDNTIRHDLNQYDVYWKMRKNPSNGWKRGFQTTILGNLKRGRLLIEELHDLHLLDTSPRKINSYAWDRSVLPKIPFEVKSRYSRMNS